MVASSKRRFFIASSVAGSWDARHFLRMIDGVLFQRIMAHGPAGGTRRRSEDAATPGTVARGVDRRHGTPRGGQGTPPRLIKCEAAREEGAVALLEPQARDDRMITQLLHAKGLR